MARFCANCGTEVDDGAAFCPACGQPLDDAVEARHAEAQAWPDDAARAADEPEPWSEPAPTREERPVAPPPAEPARPAGSDAGRRGPELNLPITWPLTLSGWLIGVGAAVGALGAVASLVGLRVNLADLVLLLLLLGVATTVFFAASLPGVPHLRLATTGVAFFGVGVALDRLAIGAGGIGTLLLFLGTAAMAIGVVVVELGRDQPLGGPSPRA